MFGKRNKTTFHVDPRKEPEQTKLSDIMKELELIRSKIKKVKGAIAKRYTAKWLRPYLSH
jgi:hypothetical protein